MTEGGETFNYYVNQCERREIAALTFQKGDSVTTVLSLFPGPCGSPLQRERDDFNHNVKYVVNSNSFTLNHHSTRCHRTWTLKWVGLTDNTG